MCTFFLSFSPARLRFSTSRSGKGEEPGGQEVLCLIQIRFADDKSAENSACLSTGFASDLHVRSEFTRDLFCSCTFTAVKQIVGPSLLLEAHLINEIWD